jgi:hypothetical protein
MYPAPVRVQYGQLASAPDLVGLPMDGTRHFTEGPFAGQTWEVGGSGEAVLVEEGSVTSAPGTP